MKLLIESQYFPAIDWFKIVKEHSHVELEICDPYKKMSFRNRCIIYGGNGLTSLTVPLAGGREQKMVMKDVQIDYSQSWQRSHIKSLVSAYNKAPFFAYYRNDLEELIKSNEKFLFDLNYKIICFFNKALKINSLIAFTSLFNANPLNVLDARNTILPKNFQLEGERWKPKYSQVFENKLGFQPNLSILDLLFCEGPNAMNML